MLTRVHSFNSNCYVFFFIHPDKHSVLFFIRILTNNVDRILIYLYQDKCQVVSAQHGLGVL